MLFPMERWNSLDNTLGILSISSLIQRVIFSHSGSDMILPHYVCIAPCRQIAFLTTCKVTLKMTTGVVQQPSCVCMHIVKIKCNLGFK